MEHQLGRQAWGRKYGIIIYFILIVLSLVLFSSAYATPLYSLKETPTTLQIETSVNNRIYASKTVYIPLISGGNSAIPAGDGIWISAEEIRALPKSGKAWGELLKAANEPIGRPDLSDQDDDVNTQTVAQALVYVRTEKEKYREDVQETLKSVTFDNSENGGRTLALGRNLFAYVVAADLIDLKNYDPALDSSFRQKLKELLQEELDGRTLTNTHEERPNNWGTHAGASRIAVALYLNDATELDRAVNVFKGWLGDRGAYAEFSWDDDMTWHCDSKKPVGINPTCTKDGHSISGAQPEEMRRGGSYQWPPKETGYPWEALQGAVVSAEMLRRTEKYHDAWEWEDKAILRAAQFIYDIGWGVDGDDEWQLWLINRAYGTSFMVVPPTRPGKNMGWTDWTHGGDVRAAADMATAPIPEHTQPGVDNTP